MKIVGAMGIEISRLDEKEGEKERRDLCMCGVVGRGCSPDRGPPTDMWRLNQGS